MRRPNGPPIPTHRLEAFTDGTIAILITILVLELRPPEGGRLGDLRDRVPVLLAFLLSFTFIAIYWNNHHHLFRVTERLSAGVMWANMHLLFWLALIPVATAWVGEHDRDAGPAALFGIVAIGCGIAYYVLVRMIVRANNDSAAAAIFAKDVKGRISVAIYAVGIATAYIHPFISYALYAVVAIIWFIPDQRTLVADGED